MISTPNSNRTTLVLIGRCNVGKSTLMNQLGGQDISIVSATAGTTTDSVQKASELLPLGPVLFIDTAGLDDQSSLAKLRQQKTLEAIKKADALLLCVKANQVDFKFEQEFIKSLEIITKPIFIIATHSDLLKKPRKLPFSGPIFYTNKDDILSITHLKTTLANSLASQDSPLIAHRLPPHSLVLLIMPQDIQAPKGRLILPQALVLRELLDYHHTVVSTTFASLEASLKNLAKLPYLVITDSQLFDKIGSYFSPKQAITSFSIILAQHKGDLDYYCQSLKVIDTLQDDDEILILEACSHHALQNDIGRTQIPNKLSQGTAKKLLFTHHSGGDLPNVDMQKFKLVVQCGSCMITQNQSQNRLLELKKLSLATTNYGVILAHFSGQLDRATKIFSS